MTATADYVVSTIDTTLLPATDRPGFWREHVRFNHGGLDFAFDETMGFSGKTVVQRSEEFQLVEFSSDAIVYSRSAVAARSDDDRSLRVVVPRAGTFRCAYGDDRAIVGRGAAVAMSMAAPFSIEHGPGARAWVVSVPESAWPRSVVPVKPRVLDLATGMGAVAAAMTEQLSAQRDALSVSSFREVSDALTRMLVGVASDESRWPDVAQSASALVKTQSDDPTLTPKTLARRLGWSLRHVQAVTQSVGTNPSEMIRTSRLVRARARLDDPAQRHRTVAEIAHQSGFGSVSTFNAVFREEFGMSPRQARTLSERR
ncbi:hypothetical protein BJD99_01740 [Rhodococcus sp. 1163]|uniref:AraC family transcriptional regulator n=1 Tax=Rhodococcus sp. 1163 TaxID=1905289 RepID=UPI0009FDACFC|nr:AraC family transcriptional regulator [Rhodococcus sp. 1163]ORI12866.1 hypothetical protein BJD99_01740 [Rhodococcus sp. 1163]